MLKEKSHFRWTNFGGADHVLRKIRIEVAFFILVFATSVFVIQPQRFHFADDSFALYDLITRPVTILQPHNEHFMPLFKLLYLLEYKAFGGRPLPYQEALLALHAVASVMVYRIGRLLLSGTAMSLAAAVIFAFGSAYWQILSWSFMQMWVAAIVLMLVALEICLDPHHQGRAPSVVAVIILVAYLVGGPIVLAFCLVLTVSCLWPIDGCAEERSRLLWRNLLLIWAPAFAYFLSAIVARKLMPVGPAVPHLHLRDIPTMIDYSMTGIVDGVVLPGLTFLHPEKTLSLPLILILLAVATMIAYFNSSTKQQRVFRLLLFSLAIPYCVISPGRIQFGVMQSMDSRYTYLSAPAFALLVAWLWQGLTSAVSHEQAKRSLKMFGILLLIYYLDFHCTVLRKDNPQVARGVQSHAYFRHFRTVMENRHGKALVIPDDMPAPTCIYRGSYYPISNVIRVFDGEPSQKVSIKDRLPSGNNLDEVDVLSRSVPDPFNGWHGYGEVVVSRPSDASARDKGIGVVLSRFLSAFGKDVVRECPSGLPTQLYWFASEAKTTEPSSVSMRLLFRNQQNDIIESFTSRPHSGDGHWQELSVSGVAPPGTCAVSVDVVNLNRFGAAHASIRYPLLLMPALLQNGTVEFRAARSVKR